MSIYFIRPSDGDVVAERVVFERTIVPPAIDGDDDVSDDEEASEPPQKRRRTSRKIVAWMFVDREVEGGPAKCRLACLNTDGSDRLLYTASSTSHIERHMSYKHPNFLKKFRDARNNSYSVAMLEMEIKQAEEKAKGRIAQRRAQKDKFFRVIDRGLDHKVQNDLELLIWSIANGVTRSALNCPIFDRFLRHAGASPRPTRHDLSSMHLHEIDEAVQDEMRRKLSSVPWTA